MVAFLTQIMVGIKLITLEYINMQNIFSILISLFIMSSCSKKEEPKFQKIKYDLSSNYKDSLGTKIIPNKKYQYWAYMSYYQNSGKEKHTVLKQGGDTLEKKHININHNILGFFEGCHPNYCCNYAVTVESDKLEYLKTKDQFRKFLGTIDNLEEAMLLARTYDYILDADIKGSAYRIINEYYELHLMKFHEYPPQKESIEIKIDKKGNIKTKSLGFYCKGQKCYE